jgi:hypothetical protein
MTCATGKWNKDDKQEETGHEETITLPTLRNRKSMIIDEKYRQI